MNLLIFFFFFCYLGQCRSCAVLPSLTMQNCSLAEMSGLGKMRFQINYIIIIYNHRWWLHLFSHQSSAQFRFFKRESPRSYYEVICIIIDGIDMKSLQSSVIILLSVEVVLFFTSAVRYLQKACFSHHLIKILTLCPPGKSLQTWWQR